MTPTDVLLGAVRTRLAQDTATLAAATALHVHLIKEPFTEGPTIDFTTMDEADFTGSTALGAGTGNQQEFVDPDTRERVIQLKEPAGGWHWVTTDAVNLPQTIYGYVVTDTADTVTYGSKRFDSPVALIASGDGVDIGNVRFNMLSDALY